MADVELLTKLKNSRKNIKSSLTRFKTAFDKLKTSKPPDINQIELRLLKIESLLEDFNKIQTQIEEVDTLSSSEEHDKERCDFEDAYFEAFSQANKLITESRVQETQQFDLNSISSVRSNEESNHSRSNKQNVTIKNVKLPPLPLPQFDGNYEQWLFFKDTFASIIHEDESIPAVQKFHYLRLSLKGEAADLLKSLECSAANYSVAWKLLVDHYENKQILIRNHIKAIFDLESVSKETYSSLRKLVTGMTKHLRALEALGQAVNSWDVLIIHIISSKLDRVTRREWETEYNKYIRAKTNVTCEMFSNFLFEKCKLLQTLNLNDENFHNKNKFDNKTTLIKAHAAIDNSRIPVCSFCNKEHTVYNCKDFLALSISNRISEAKRLSFCLNCLRKNHTTDKCKSFSCRKCQGRHNTLLHLEFNDNETKNKSNTTQMKKESSNVAINELSTCDDNTIHASVSYVSGISVSTGVLLSTALVNVVDVHNNTHQCRILLDNGSQSNFISSSLCKKLGIPLSNVEYTVSGIGQAKTNITKKAYIKLEARHNAFQLKLDCLVLPRVTSNIPSASIDVGHLKIPPKLILADPTFNEVGSIDILIGVDQFWGLLEIGQIKLGKNLPTLQKTHLGWIISGSVYPLQYLPSNKNLLCNFSQTTTLDTQLTRFWEIEETNIKKPLSSEEQACEDSFKNHTIRDSSGRFVVTLPLKHSPAVLGDSLQMTERRFLMLEKRLNKNPNLLQEYSKFLDEYESLGHMSKINLDDIDLNNSFFLPHHCVFKEISLTTKLRVVFDGSAKTTSNYSLNDILLVGPTVQEDLFSIVLRSRKYNIILTGDIEKMYRQVLVRKDQRNLQIILWRPNPSVDIQYYTLNTLTYGTAPAAYLSTRCIKELANLNALNNSKISAILARDFYVDDLLTGGQTVDEVKTIKHEVSEILKAGGFSLRKFLSNSNEVLSDSNSSSDTIHQFANTQQGKTLGLLWDSAQDTLCYSIRVSTETPVTKRSILSTIAQIYDPLGLLAPTVIIAKIIIQRLWLCKLSWDESIPVELFTNWKQFHNELTLFNHLKIPRRVLCNFPIKIELHAFSDASESAYGSCIYLKSIDNGGMSHIHLLCAKTRVAPLKTITIPRLELCAALLSAELTAKVKNALNLNIDAYFYWCDSTIVLSWIKASPHLWKIFVSNRVAQIQSMTDVDSWHYVNTRENPADLLSRGILPSHLENNKLWWNGPSWLSTENYSHVDTSSLANENLNSIPEFRSKDVLSATVIVTDNNNFRLIENYSNLNRLIKVAAYCIRFYNNLKLSKSSNDPLTGPLSFNEINHALYALVKFVQSQEFAQDIRDLNKFGQVKSKSRLLRLSPFVDNNGILRVGGRIKHSNFSYHKKFPAILPGKHALSKLIVEREHIRLLHAGAQCLLASIREQFWILSARNLVKNVVRKCTRCFRFNTPENKYKMGDLPSFRVTPTRPFLNTGIDFCGPFNVKDRITRNYKVMKTYICLFICLSTKAIHLELVSDLSTTGFLAALRRFFARRGLSANVYSDNGSTFVGANNEIKTFLNANQNQVRSQLMSEGVKWHFIPPRAPNFGGLWEAGVKSTKYHLKRVLFNTVLTFEEFATVLTQVEACLNSRPLCPISSDPHDPEPLTPGHFLIGTKLTAMPETNYENTPQNRLSKFQLAQKLVQHFWARWSKEYISELQQRVKWKKNYNQVLKPGVVVLVKEDNLPPLKWQLGLVQSINPGPDGIVRAAIVKTSTAIYKRPASKLCVLPNQEEEE